MTEQGIPPGYARRLEAAEEELRETREQLRDVRQRAVELDTLFHVVAGLLVFTMTLTAASMVIMGVMS